MALTWHGDRLKARVREAAIDGVNATMAAAVIHAKSHHPWENRSGTLEGSISIHQYAQQEGDVVRGTWGSADVEYALALELGARPHIIRPRLAQALFWPGARHPVMVVHHPGNPPMPFLRPAADATYPRLAGLIQRALRRGR